MRWKLLLVLMMILPLFLGAVAALDTTVRWDLLNEPTVITDPATNITSNSAILHGNLTDLGDASEVNVSFEYGKSPVLGEETDNETLSSTGEFNFTLLNLESNVDYYFRAKAEGNGTVYGSIRTFRTEAIGMTPQDMAFFVGLAIFLFFTALGFAYKNEVMLFLAGIIGIVFGVWLMAVTGIGAVGLFVLGPGIVVMVIGTFNIWEEYG